MKIQKSPKNKFNNTSNKENEPIINLKIVPNLEKKIQELIEANKQLEIALTSELDEKNFILTKCETLYKENINLNNENIDFKNKIKEIKSQISNILSYSDRNKGFNTNFNEEEFEGQNKINKKLINIQEILVTNKETNRILASNLIEKDQTINNQKEEIEDLKSKLSELISFHNENKYYYENKNEILSIKINQLEEELIQAHQCIIDLQKTNKLQ